MSAILMSVLVGALAALPGSIVRLPLRLLVAVPLAVGFSWLAAMSYYGPVGGVLPFVALLLVVRLVLLLFRFGYLESNNRLDTNEGAAYKRSVLAVGGGALTAVLLLIGFWVCSWSMFHARHYAGLIGRVDEKAFADNQAVDPAHIRMVSEEQAHWKADKAFGQAGTLGSQFELGEGTIQRVRGRLVWVYPLEFGGFFRWLNLRETPGHIEVDAEDATSAARLHLEGKPIRYAQSACFNADLTRHVVYSGFGHYRLDGWHLELDDEGNRWWVVSALTPTVSWSGEQIVRLLLVDPTTGAIQEYEPSKAPAWVDRIVPEDIAQERINSYGSLREGWYHSTMFSNGKGLFKVTEPNNTDALWLTWGSDGNAEWFSGITSVRSDQSLTGVVTVDSRTGKATIFDMAGDNEDAVLTRLGNGVSNYEGWHPKMPILYMIGGEPTWVAPIVRNGELQQLGVAHASKNVKAYGHDKREALSRYALELHRFNSDSPAAKASKVETTTTVKRAQAVVQEGETAIYLLTADSPDLVFRAPASLSPMLPLIRPGDRVRMHYVKPDGQGIVVIEEIQVLEQAAQ